jgi:hypothetical protein
MVSYQGSHFVGETGLSGCPDWVAIAERRARYRGKVTFADHADDHLDPLSLQQMKCILQEERFGAAARQFRIGDAADPRPRRDLDRFGFQKIRHA